MSGHNRPCGPHEPSNVKARADYLRIRRADLLERGKKLRAEIDLHARLTRAQIRTHRTLLEVVADLAHYIDDTLEELQP
jgi:hypothetical protein